jgi:hypothetical protein
MRHAFRVFSCATILITLATPLLAQTFEGATGQPPDPARDATLAVLPVPHEIFEAHGIGGSTLTHQRDSLWNGALVGAGLGAMVGVAVGISQDDRCRGCAGFNMPLTYGVVSAGIGAAIGAGVDALFYRRGGDPVRRSSERRTRLFPWLSKEARGIAGSIRF